MAPGAQPLFSKGRDVGIVLENYRRAQSLLNLASYGVFRPSRKVGRVPHHAGGQINDSGHADSHAQQLAGRFVFAREMADGFAHLVQDVVAALDGFGAQRDFLDQPSLLFDSRNPQVGPAQVDSDCKVRHKVTKQNRLHRGLAIVDF